MSEVLILNPVDEDLSFEQILLEEQIMGRYRVYADGTVQNADEEKPFSFMSDDFVIVRAIDEEHAYAIWQDKNKGAA
ncbi:hypothetical protein LNQ82_04540 [Conchiformibius steedae DSM 2580]|uniref:Uncharacterized protein n=1 Tax=Conchiformibius steedae DSM 2580 TaxID=1121352 RepID=A0AAE9HVK4_9NEIS|nr:hypothetical protein [Conchiformibius steedae]QMT33758.1 hypothetical protein H3L98_01620 [Conchiformibius steedae]URD68419.1 hypothetical protein LNQ82_04540 [Conchiformibius steedae DSM 2580]